MTSGKQVLVTGAAGFIGSHLVEALLQQGFSVRALVRYTSRRTDGWLDELAPALRSGLDIVRGDIRDERLVREAVRGCDTVFHLAALIGIPYSYAAPRSYVDVNVAGTLNVLEAARDLGVCRTLVTSTSEVYGTALYTPIDEGHPLQAQSPYAASKIAADQIALSYHRAFGLPVVVVRPFNTYGPRQSARAVIPTIVSQALAAKRIEIGSLRPVRDMVFVTDTAAGFVALAGSDGAVGQVVNLATGRGVSVRELLSLILQHVGRDVPLRQTEERRRPATSEVFALVGSDELARRLTGWRAMTRLEDGVSATVSWIEAHLAHFRTGDYCV